MIPTTFNSRMEVMCVKMESLVVLLTITAIVNAFLILFCVKTDLVIRTGRRIVKCLKF
jgi:hypothetical protein